MILVVRLMCEQRLMVATVSNITSQVIQYHQYFVATQLVKLFVSLRSNFQLAFFVAVKRKHAQMVPDKVDKYMRQSNTYFMSTLMV